MLFGRACGLQKQEDPLVSGSRSEADESERDMAGKSSLVRTRWMDSVSVAA
jgi:hypothetical protein